MESSVSLLIHIFFEVEFLFEERNFLSLCLYVRSKRRGHLDVVVTLIKGFTAILEQIVQATVCKCQSNTWWKLTKTWINFGLLTIFSVPSDFKRISAVSELSAKKLRSASLIGTDFRSVIRYNQWQSCKHVRISEKYIKDYV